MLTIKQTKTIEDKLLETDMRVKVRQPKKDTEFRAALMGMNGKGIDLWPGNVDLKVFTNKRYHQAILWVDENERVIEEQVSLYRNAEPDDEGMKRFKRNVRYGFSFPVALPDGTKFKITEGPKWVSSSYSVGGGSITATVQATAPASEQTFLIGKDEGSHFVCALPERVKTIPEAYEVLRPGNVPKGSPRQGEWFFVPVTDQERTKIEENIHSNSIRTCWLDMTESSENFRGSYHEDLRYQIHATTHKAMNAIVLDRQLYVCGYIVDDRGGNTPRHEPLWLHDWHKVVRNLEIEADEEMWD